MACLRTNLCVSISLLCVTVCLEGERLCLYVWFLNNLLVTREPFPPPLGNWASKRKRWPGCQSYLDRHPGERDELFMLPHTHSQEPSPSWWKRYIEKILDCLLSGPWQLLFFFLDPSVIFNSFLFTSVHVDVFAKWPIRSRMYLV